jgi:protein involved in polysaccharide export with SLBB domain
MVKNRCHGDCKLQIANCKCRAQLHLICNLKSAIRNLLLPMFSLALLACLQGCATQGAVAVKDVNPEYLAPPPKLVKTLDLTKLARPTEAQNRLLPGDVLEVNCSNLYEESSRESKESERFPVRIASDGTVSLPLLPQRVRVSSMTVGEAEQVMRNAYRTAELIRRPQLTVKVLEYKKNKIYVIGAVKKPGMYQLRPDHCDPLRAIAAAEGVSEEAGTVVEIRRAAKGPWQKPPGVARSGERAPSKNEGVLGVVYVGDDDSLKKAQDPPKRLGVLRPPGAFPIWKPESSPPPIQKKVAPDEPITRFDLTSNDIRMRPDQLQLQNGDIVSVEQKKIRPFFVTGSVNKPGEFPMPMGRDIRVLEAVGMAGGILPTSDPNHALLIRRPVGKAPIVVHIELDRAGRYPQENLSLMEGDVIEVVEDAASRTRRTIRQFLRVGFTPLPRN